MASSFPRINAWVIENEGVMRLVEVLAVVLGVSIALFPIFQTRDNIKIVRDQIEQAKIQNPIKTPVPPQR